MIGRIEATRLESDFEYRGARKRRRARHAPWLGAAPRNLVDSIDLSPAALRLMSQEIRLRRFHERTPE